MTTNLAVNIRKYRKKRGLTQEQLAEALGVTTGAVYKWEAEKSLPEIGMLMEIADFFDMSVDVLLGYEVRKNDRGSTLARLKAYVHNRNSEESLVEAEKALKKYPNYFDVVYVCAKIYQVRGYDFQRKDCFGRALELLERAKLLFEQNTDEMISMLSMQRDIAEIYVQLEKPEKAVEILKKENPARVNHALIGNALASGCKKYEESMEYLSLALLDSIVSQMFIISGYVNVYEHKKDYQSVIDILEWLLTIFHGLKVENKSNFLEKFECLFLIIESDMYYRLGKMAEAIEYMKTAKATAEQFDVSPDYGVNHVRFIVHHEEGSSHDDLGETAMLTIENYVKKEADENFRKLWTQIFTS